MEDTSLNLVVMIEISVQKILKSSTGEMKLDLKIQFEEGKLITVYGKSGAGKSTLLMLLAGLMNPENGYISMGKDVWTDTTKNIFLPPQKRNIGFVFQEYALFPNMTVKENLLFALAKKQPISIIDQLVEIID